VTQLDAQFFCVIRLFQSSTCFDQTRVHHQEVNCINTASGIVNVMNVKLVLFVLILYVIVFKFVCFISN